jgi:hypothetical protein
MTEKEKTVLSEDPNAGLATPVMDLVTAGVIGAIGIWFAIESLRLPTPGGLITAPGLLPFLTAGSLVVMAALLALAALRRRRSQAAGETAFELPPDFRRSLLLGAILAVYVAALQFLPVAAAMRIGSLRLVIGSFEVATFIAIVTVLRIFWRPVLWPCLAIAFGWVAFLSLVFRLVFEIQLP